MTVEWWIAFVERAGAVAAVLEFGALMWMNTDRKRLLESLSSKDKIIALKDEKLASISERALVLMAKIETWFQSGRAA